MKIKTFIKENTWLPGSGGWGNGYCIIPRNHPLHGKNYNEYIKLNIEPDWNGNPINLFTASSDMVKQGKYRICDAINVHYGITFSGSVDDYSNWKEIPKNCDGWWIFGFDTLHHDDDKDKWSKLKVQKEADKLKHELLKIVNHIES